MISDDAARALVAEWRVSRCAIDGVPEEFEDGFTEGMAHAARMLEALLPVQGPNGCTRCVSPWCAGDC